MFVLALIFLLLAILLLFAGLFGGTGAAHLDLGSFKLDTNSTVIFFLGMATLLLFVLSLVMIRTAGRRARERRRDRKKVGELREKLDEYKQRQDTDPEDSGRHSGSGTRAADDTSADASTTDATRTDQPATGESGTDGGSTRPGDGGSSHRA